MTRRRDLSPDEAKLWHRVANSTKAYRALAKNVVPVTEATLEPVVSKARAPELPHVALKRAKAARVSKSPPMSKPSVKLASVRPVADASGHKKVRRGKLDIDARIDLHGMRQIEAHTALAGVIARTRDNQGRCVLVVTGKGRLIDPGEDFITPQPGVIRRRLPEWLSGAGIREHVSGFAQANAKDGGSGAFYVLLKARVR
jgi:DNA-nicking Smr family endonuclease